MKAPFDAMKANLIVGTTHNLKFEAKAGKITQVTFNQVPVMQDMVGKDVPNWVSNPLGAVTGLAAGLRLQMDLLLGRTQLGETSRADLETADRARAPISAAPQGDSTRFETFEEYRASLQNTPPQPRRAEQSGRATDLADAAPTPDTRAESKRIAISVSSDVQQAYDADTLEAMARSVETIIDNFENGPDRFDSRNAALMRERGATVQIVDLSGEGIQAVYDSNTKTLEISADRIAQALSDPAAMAKLRAVVAHELQHLWHAERYADGHSFLHPDASTAQFTPSSVEDYAAKREAYTDVSVERGLADEVLSHHQHLLKGANYAPNSLYGQLATVFGNTQYGRLSREQFLEARRLIADFGYRERIAEAAAQTFDDVHGRMLDSSSQPRASVDGESSAPRPASAGETFTYGMRDNAGNTVSVALAFDALAFNDSTRTLEFERASGLDRYFFGMPDATGTVKQAILAQVVSVTEPGSTPEMPDFEYGVFFHDLHPLMGDSNGIGEGGYYARFSNEVELGGPLIDLVTSTGIDHVQAHAEILRLLPFDEMASRYAASAIRALFERARTGLNRRDPRDETHNFALNNLLNEAANTKMGLRGMRSLPSTAATSLTSAHRVSPPKPSIPISL